MYCSAFRRLSSKTQVFNSQKSDNLRTRLTHTLEVAQIARTISCQLGLDEELTEAIALGHDVGHTPFGHVGERELNRLSRGLDKQQIADGLSIDASHFGFKHNLQGVRVLVEYSEKVNFSNYMLFGVREHSKRWWESETDVSFYKMYDTYCSYSVGDVTFPAWSFEAFIVHWADEIAQRHHDIEDAFLQKIISPNDIVAKVHPLATIIDDVDITRKYTRLTEERDKLARKDRATEQYAFAHTLSSFLVDAYVTVLIKELSSALSFFVSEILKIKDEKSDTDKAKIFEEKYPQINVEDVRKLMSLQSTNIFKIDKQLGKSLKYNILDSYEVQRMDGKGAYTIRKLFRAYVSNPQQLPNEYVNRFIKIELPRALSKSKYEKLKNSLQKKLNGNYTENTNMWKDYECREVLRIICDDNELKLMAYDALIRVIFDYIAGMTDSFAMAQRMELY